MKGAAVCALEAAQVLAESGPFKGELVLVLIGLHEAPGGRGEDLTHLLTETGFTADYAVVCELSGHNVAVAHMGQATVEITITRPGMPTHELQTPAGTPHPLRRRGARDRGRVPARSDGAGRGRAPVGRRRDVLLRRGARRRLLQPLARERAASSARAAGRPATRSRRSRPSTARCSTRVAAETGCDDRPRPAPRARRRTRSTSTTSCSARCSEAYEEVTGKPLEPVGVKVVADAAIFWAAGIPTVYHGPVGSGAHADVEYIEVPELVRATEVYLALLRRLF